MKIRRSCLWLLGFPGLIFAVDAPSLEIQATTDGVQVTVDLNWTPDPAAGIYRVYYQPDLTESWSLLGRTFTSSYHASLPTGWDWQHQPLVTGFFTVVADSNDTPLDMVVVPAGSFIMGRTNQDLLAHPVTITHDFILGTTETTNVQFIEAARWALEHGLVNVMDNKLYSHDRFILDLSSPYSEISYINGQLDLQRAPGAGQLGFDDTNYDPSFHPVKLTWYAATCYCDWRSLMGGFQPYYNGNWEQLPESSSPYLAQGYRLPTEAEWEYATQFGGERYYPWGDEDPSCDIANYYPCVGWSSPVGSHPAGSTFLDLQDMGGNVFEWTNDRFAVYDNSAQVDPVGPFQDGTRVARGGSWMEGGASNDCCSRTIMAPGSVYFDYQGYGFRIARRF